MTIPRAERSRKHRWRRRAGIVLLVAALAASAWGVWTYVIPHRADVPSLAGVSIADAQTQLSDLGFTVKIAEGRYDEGVPAQHVLKVQPGAGTSLERGETVTLTPSLGPPPVKIPSIEGKSLDKARALLADVGFTLGAQTRAFSDTVPEGSIIEAPGGMQPQGSAVDVVVSKGPPPADIPKVVGLTEDEATSALTDLGFVVTPDTDFSNKVERGSVISIDPKAGLTRPYGSTVTIVVSLGPETFPAPSFTGLSKSAAEARAAEYGLEVSWFVVPGSGGSIVIGQNPGAGGTVSYGDSIVLYLA